MVTEARLVQYSNAPSPIEETELGIVTETRLEQPPNAPSPIEVTELGIVTVEELPIYANNDVLVLSA